MIPLIDTQGHGPVRCSRCRAYVNPFFKFVDNGQKFICNLCQASNKGVVLIERMGVRVASLTNWLTQPSYHPFLVPEYYYCNLDGSNVRRDRNQRPELCRGSVEYIATPEFIAHPIQVRVVGICNMDWNGLDWIGLDWIGLDWIGLDRSN